MFCPNCKCEYIRGVTRCADCDVALVDSLASVDANPAEDARIVPFWRGNDSAEFDRVKEALESAEIPYTAPDSKGFFSFLPTESRMEIWISEADQEKAEKLLLDLDGSVAHSELTPDELESMALPESDQMDTGEQETQPLDSSDDWYEDDPVAEVWNGDKEDFADNLSACLREIGIGSRKFSEEGHWRLVVRPEQESRAREIVREVVEASPPE